MASYDEKILSAKMTQNGVIEALKKAANGDMTTDSAKEWFRELSEIYLAAAKDIDEYTQKKEEAAKAEEVKNELF